MTQMEEFHVSRQRTEGLTNRLFLYCTMISKEIEVQDIERGR